MLLLERGKYVVSSIAIAFSGANHADSLSFILSRVPSNLFFQMLSWLSKMYNKDEQARLSYIFRNSNYK